MKMMMQILKLMLPKIIQFNYKSTADEAAFMLIALMIDVDKERNIDAYNNNKSGWLVTMLMIILITII